MKLTIAMLTPIERRVLEYLDQRGPRHRGHMVIDLAAPGSKASRGFQGGSNGAAPLIVGKWCKRLIAAGWVQMNTDRGFYRDHAITNAGRMGLRHD